MWGYDKNFAIASQFKKMQKKHPNEFVSCFANLEKILNTLNNGIKLPQIKVGFFRSERGGVYRISQSGIRSAKETRLYIYFYEKNEIIYILGLGTKDQQSAEINQHVKTVITIKKRQKEVDNG